MMTRAGIGLLMGLLWSAVAGGESLVAKEGMRFYGAAARGGDVQAQYYLGRVLLEAEPEQALHWLELAWSQGSLGAGAYLSDIFLHGRYGFDRDLQRVVKYLTKMAESGHVGAQYKLGRVLEYLGEDEQGYSWVRRAALNNHVHAMRHYGIHLLQNVDLKRRQRGGAAPLVEGLAWLLVAGRHGDSEAYALSVRWSERIVLESWEAAQALANELHADSLGRN